MGGITQKESREGARDFQEDKGEQPDSNKDFSAAEHQARNDYQDAGSPFGDLENRDRDSKADLPDVVDDDDEDD